MASSRPTIWRTQIFSAAARILPAPNDFVHQKYATQTNQKSYPRGVQFYVNHLLARPLFSVRREPAYSTKEKFKLHCGRGYLYSRKAHILEE